MALTALESLVLWGVPVVTILVTVGYYLKWGKEAEELDAVDDPESSAGGGGN